MGYRFVVLVKAVLPKKAPSRGGAGSCEAPSHQLATRCWLTHSGDLVLDTFPRGKAVPPFFFFFLLLPLLCTLSPLLCPQGACGAALSVPLPPPRCIFLCHSFLGTLTHHTLPQPLSNVHTKGTDREREREENPSFFKKKGKKKNPGYMQAEEPYHSFSLLKCSSEKRCRWGLPLPQDLAAWQPGRDAV